MNKSIREREDTVQQVTKQEEILTEISKQYEKLKTLLDRKDQCRTRRANTRTTLETITNGKSATRYRRREETKNVLEFIHGGEDGALFGAWDFLSANAPKETMENLIGKYRRGKYVEGIVIQTVKELTQTNSSLSQAVALKYNNFLSRRKFNLLCKTQSSVFDTDKEVWVPRNVKCLGVDIQLSLSHISNESIEKFVKTLDIGCVCQIPDVPGVTRMITGVVFMIMDLHLRLPHLCRQLVWFNGNTNHFVFQFSDDGAPETSQLSMSIGSLTFWNLGERVRSREFQYLLHCVSLSEKHGVLELLWQQHTEEMLLLESSVFTVFGKECTLEFQPSADMSWQSWACNELNQAATYPSPYANVHKGNMCTMGGSIGHSNTDMWKPYVCSDRDKHLSMINTYLASLPKGRSPKVIHDRKLAFMADNGIRQLGNPRIGIYADRVKPDPLHCEINAWQHILDLLYSESVRRCAFDKFIQTLSAPIALGTVDSLDGTASSENSSVDEKGVDVAGTEVDGANGLAEGSVGTDGICQEDIEKGDCYNKNLSPGVLRQFCLLEVNKKVAVDNMSTMLKASAFNLPNSPTGVYGCGLSYLSTKVQEHYADEAKRFNKLSVRLIGAQAITLARRGYRLVDCLKMTNETEGEKLKRLALAKIVEYLRNAGGLFNKVYVNSPGEISQLGEFCQLYFNLLVLFFPESVNVTVWTVAYALPFHANQLYEKYGIGFGILSLQAKESKHSGLKGELSLTNRSRSSDKNGKWWQLMRSNYIRSFYLPEHQPAPPCYTSHFKSHKPPHCDLPCYCDCGREKVDVEHTQCHVCCECALVVSCAQQQKLSPDVVAILKPCVCNICNRRFANKAGLKVHQDNIHITQSVTFVNPKTSLKSLTVDQLKRLLRDKGLSTSGKKDILLRRLEGEMSGES